MGGDRRKKRLFSCFREFETCYSFLMIYVKVVTNFQVLPYFVFDCFPKGNKLPVISPL